MYFRIAAVAYVVFNLGMACGMLGDTGDAYVIGLDHIVAIALYCVLPTLFGYLAGRESK